MVLAIPIPALHEPLAALAKRHAHVRRALDGSASVATRAAQVWSRRALDVEGITTGFACGYPTFADLSEVLASERWDADGPRGLAYLVDTAPDDTADADQAVSRWAQASMPPGDEVSRYVRVNAEPSERYVLSLPGTLEDRLSPEDRRVPNLRYAGDWTATSINGGSVEAAFESGERAAASL